MTHQPLETKSTSKKFETFPDLYRYIPCKASIHPIAQRVYIDDGLELARKELKEQSLKALFIKSDISESANSDRQSGGPPSSNTQELREKYIIAQAEVNRLQVKVKLLNQLSDPVRKGEYDNLYQKISESKPDKALEEACLKQWNEYNRSMDKKASATTPVSTQQPTLPVESKIQTTPSTQPPPSEVDVYKLSMQTFFEENKRREEKQRRVAENQRIKEIGEVLKTYRDLKADDVHPQNIEFVVGEQLKKLKITTAQLSTLGEVLDNYKILKPDYFPEHLETLLEEPLKKLKEFGITIAGLDKLLSMSPENSPSRSLSG